MADCNWSCRLTCIAFGAQLNRMGNLHVARCQVWEGCTKAVPPLTQR